MMTLEELLKEVNRIACVYESKTKKYLLTFVDFKVDTVNGAVYPDIVRYEDELIDSVNVSDDFTPAYNDVINNILSISDHSIEPNFQKTLNTKIIKEDSTYSDKLKYKIVGASNYIAANGRIGQANFIICNESNKVEITNALGYDNSNSMNMVVDENVQVDKIYLGRVNGKSQPNVCFVYYKEGDDVFYSIIKAGNQPESQYISFEI